MSTEPNTHALAGTSLEAVMGRVDEAICAFDDDWQITYINDQAAAMLEYTPDELLGEDIWTVTPTLDETVVGDRLQEAMSTGTPTRFERYNAELDRWFKIRIYPDDNGATACFYDITDDRADKLELQRQRQLFETVFEETEDALIVADTDRRIIDFNPAAEQLFGYDASEVIGETTRLLYADADEYDRQGDRRFNEDAPMCEKTYLVEYERSDGTTFVGETLETSLKRSEGETLAFLGSVRDASARIEYEQTLEAHNDALQTFHDISTDDDWAVDEQIGAVLELGCEHLGLDIGILSAIEDTEYTVEQAHAPDGSIQLGEQFDLGETFCDRVVDNEELVTVTDAGNSELADHPAYEIQGLESYIGTPVVVDGERYGTLNFSQPTPRERPFTESERTLVRLFAQWIGKELSREQNRKRAAENRDRLRQIIDLLPQLVFAKDRDNEYILANQAIADAYGSTVDEVEGSTDADFVSSEAEAEQFRQDDLAVMDSGEPKHIPEEPLTKANGETVMLQTIKIPYDPVDHDVEAVLGVATDISEMTEQRRKLEETSQRLTLALEATNAGVWELNLETKEVVWTDSMGQLFGLDPDTSDGSYAEFVDLVHPDDVPAVQEALETTTEDGDTLQVEYRVEQDDGTYMWVEARAELVAGENTARRLVGIATDITDRKERTAEIELQSAAMEVAMDGIAILDGDEYVYMNQAHADIFDYDPEELLGCEWRDLYGDDEIERLEAEVFPELADTGSWRGETIGKKQDGTPVTQDLGLALLDSGELICTNQDITERREREQELRELKERLDLAVEGASLGVWDWDVETDAVTFNDQWASMLGFSLDELEPRLETWEDRIHPADMPDVEAALNAHLSGDAELYDCEHRMQTKGGEWRWMRDVGKVVDRADDGTPRRAVGIHLDITDEKKSKLHLEEERDMFAEGPAVVFKWENDEGWPVEYVSENVAEAFGYTPEQLTSGAVPYTDLIHDDDLERVVSEVDKQADETTERFSHDPYRMVTNNGEVRWVTDNTKLLRTDGEITHYLGYLIDITEQKRLEGSLRESEQSLQELTSIASNTDREFEDKLTALLELGVERLGLPYGFLNRIDNETQHVVQAIGDHPELQTGASAPTSQSYCRKTIEQSTPLSVQNAVAEGWEGDPAYERFDLGCYIGGSVTVDGSLYGTLCFADRQHRDHEFTDTERTFVELLVQWISHELSRAAVETKLRQINETGQQFMSVPSKEQIASLAIESAESILDVSAIGLWWYDEDRDALVPERMSEAATEYVSEQPVFERGTALAWEAFDTGEVGVYDDLSAVDRMYNEQTEFNSETIVPLGSHGVLCAGSVDYQSFSETEISLLEVLSSTVEAALARAERETELREAQAALKQSNEELEQFAYAASHDLQEPLRTVSSYLTLLERRYGDDLDSDATEFIEFAVDGADRMRNMIQALLAYSRVDTRGNSFESVGVDELFERVTSDLTVKIAETDATVSTPSTDTTVRGDPSQLAQLFQNIVDNAIKYNTGQPVVDISAHRHDGIVTIEVTDNGIGMEADQIDGIFEVFQRLHTREEFEGTGIGLSVCRKIVDRHGGDIEVKSKPGEGSTFIISLPKGADTDE